MKEMMVLIDCLCQKAAVSTNGYVIWRALSLERKCGAWLSPNVQFAQKRFTALVHCAFKSRQALAQLALEMDSLSYDEEEEHSQSLKRLRSSSTIGVEPLEDDYIDDIKHGYDDVQNS